MDDPRGRVAARRTEAEALLRRWVDQPSGSHDREGVARMVDLVAEELSAIGLEVEVHREGGAPRHLTARLRPEGPAQRRVLVIGHCDTVFPRSDTRRLTCDDERFFGPGCADMKGGLVVACEALRIMRDPLRASGTEVEVIVNGDEELGSPHSRGLIEERARGALAALVFENCEQGDGLIVGRKGLGRARVEIEGRAAHAGINPEEGASAVVEMARQVVDASALDDPEGGVGVVVGIARGGISRNTVPPSAELAIDIRYRDKQRAAQVLARLEERGSRTVVPGTRSRFRGELHRPPMLEGAAHQQALLALATEVAAAQGIALHALVTGGGSDANLTSDLGVPSIDGLGVVGAEIHTVREWCYRGSLVEKAILTARLLDRLTDGFRVQSSPLPQEAREQ